MESQRIQSASYVEEDPCSNPCVADTIGEVISRRSALRMMTALAAGSALAAGVRGQERGEAAVTMSGVSSLTFRELRHGNDPQAHVAEGYDVQVLLRWGDPLQPSAPQFDPARQSAEAQAQQVGYNCDYTAFIPLPPGPGGTQRGLLCVNHEYTDTNLMFPGIVDAASLQTLPRELVDVELAAHGHTVVELERRGGTWRMVLGSRLNRRLTALDTPIEISGPAAGHPRLQTRADASGRRVIGTLNNCGGGVTPWGTLLICEENFNNYFSGDAERTTEARNHKRYGIGGPSRFSPAWAQHYSRFQVEAEPHEPNRFGWVVEFDPTDPARVPVKRTALGRVKHEGAGIVVNGDGRVVVYCGDDERFDYVYRFVTSRPWNPQDKEANRDLLDDGTLYVARFSEAGLVEWLPLVFGSGPLTPENDFHSQADVLIETRRAADLMGATPMDRPEDVEVSPTSGHVFVMLTNNDKRVAERADAANPRGPNAHGHILELVPPQRGEQVDHAAGEFRWEVFLRGGDPSVPAHDARYHSDVSSDGWFSSPDNGAFDSQGRLWLTTDSDPKLTGFGDGVYGCDAEGAGRALPKLFFRGPRGSEVSGVCLTPDDQTLFVSVQHPGEEDGSDYQKPSTRWPDFDPALPPRPAVVAITRRGGGRIGS